MSNSRETPLWQTKITQLAAQSHTEPKLTPDISSGKEICIDIMKALGVHEVLDYILAQSKSSNNHDSKALKASLDEISGRVSNSYVLVAKQDVLLVADDVFRPVFGVTVRGFVRSHLKAELAFVRKYPGMKPSQLLACYYTPLLNSISSVAEETAKFLFESPLEPLGKAEPPIYNPLYHLFYKIFK